MAITFDEAAAAGFDLSDVLPRVGQLCGGGELIEPCSKLDIRRWVMGMDYANPLHWDHHFAATTKFGDIVAPQSMAVALDYGDGVGPSLVGKIPNSHMLFGGEEWWFYGHTLRAGDQLSQERRLHDIRLTESAFAGPTLIERGDTVHRLPDGTLVAKERATSIRYLAAEAERRKRELPDPTPPAPKWTAEQLREVARVRRDWILSNRNGVSPKFGSVKEGDRLPTRAIGPHTIQSFATEWRAFPFTTWGSYDWVGVPGMKDPWINQDAGWAIAIDYEEGKIDPRAVDGLYSGPASGHTDTTKGAEIGLTRAYGYGASMGAWVTDYLAYWAGHDGMVRHTKVAFKSPSYEGDVSYCNAEVLKVEATSSWGCPLVYLKVVVTNQDGIVLIDGTAEVELPL